MYFPATRVLTVLELLQARGQMSGPELAARLEVDARTVRRYITMLQDLGIPVEAERGRYGTYRLRPGFKLPPLLFTDDEAFALTLGLLLARKLELATAAPAVEGALAKLERVLPIALRERILAVQDTLVLDMPPPKTSPHQSVVVTLSDAASQQRRVRLRYRAFEAKTETERDFDPYGLVYRPGFWYVVGYCHLREDLRVFRLDRILSVKELTIDFVRPDKFDCRAYVQQAIPSTPATWHVEVLLEISLEEARRIVPSAIARLEEHPQGVMFTAYFEHLDHLAGILVSLRCPLVVYRPPELRDALRQIAEQATLLADRMPPPASSHQD